MSTIPPTISAKLNDSVLTMVLISAIALSGCAKRSSGPRYPPIPPQRSDPPVSDSIRLTGATGGHLEPDDPGSRPADPYSIAFGQLKVTHYAGNDFFSSPDIYIRVVRTDRAVSDQITRLHISNKRIRNEISYLQSTFIEPLFEKKRNSELFPGEPLSDIELHELLFLRKYCKELKQRRCKDCSRFDLCDKCDKCEKLPRIEARKKESEIVPGKPLTELERQKLFESQEQSDSLEILVQSNLREVAELNRLIIGRTNPLHPSNRRVNFAFSHVLDVYPNDTIEISVWDDDVSHDDLYGKTRVRLTSNILDSGSLDVRIPTVESLQIRFTRK